jgi:hypothetical protein
MGLSYRQKLLFQDIQINASATVLGRRGSPIVERCLDKDGFAIKHPVLVIERLLPEVRIFKSRECPANIGC